MMHNATNSQRLRLPLLLAVTLAFGSGRTLAFTSIFPIVLPNQERSLSTLRLSEQVDETVDGDVLTFQQQTKALCEQRNLPFQKVKNARDLASVQNSPILPGKMFRTGRVSDATDKDIQLLFDSLRIQTLVDLRSPTELKEDKTLWRDEVFASFTNILWTERNRQEPGCVRELASGESPFTSKRRFWKNGSKSPTTTSTSTIAETATTSSSSSSSSLMVLEECEACDDSGAIPANLYKSPKNRMERHFVSLMNELKYVRGTLSKLRKRDIARALLKSPGAIVSRRVRVSCKKPFLDEINSGGLPMLNDLLLRYGAPGIKYVLDLCADPNRHPIAFYCTAGKDRTGMIAAILLSLVGVPDEDIVEDYSLSANVYAEMNDHQAMVGALSQRSLDPKTFLGAPPHVMRTTLQTIREKYGSVEGYLDWIGFGPESQKKLRDALLRE